MSDTLTLAALAPRPFWVAWQTEVRTPGKPPTKVPYSPNGRRAEADAPATWGTRAEAEKRATLLPKPFGAGGVGIEFAPLGDGRSLAGIDLDLCRNPETGFFEAWAEDVLASFDTYAETSPSLTGAKAFFTFDTDAMTAIRPALGSAEFGKQFKRGGGEHPPAIELYLGSRYFAVTDAMLAGSPAELRHVETARIIRLIEVDGPAFVGGSAKRGGSKQAGGKASPGGFDKSRSAAAFRVGGAARRKPGATFETMCAALRTHSDTAEWFAEKGDAANGRELKRIWEKTDPFEGDLILSGAAPLRSAQRFIGRLHTSAAVRTLHHQNGMFYAWRGSHYIEQQTEEMRAALYRFLEPAKQLDDQGEAVDFNPTKNKVANILEATAAEAQLPLSTRPPAWLDGTATPKARDLIACTNGLLDLSSNVVRPHTPTFFTLNALDFDYQPDAPEPKAWLNFLTQLWPEDPSAIRALQEMCGLCLTGETRYQKAFLIVGPKRSGKGTIARVLSQLLGAANVCGPTLSGLGTNFGLAPLIGKRLAIISDARLGGKADQQVIVERLLAITGEDGLTIDRKFRDGWTGKLDVRFLILTNELPRLTDSSGALASRFVILTMTQSFYGKEDMALGDKLAQELPGILLWAIEGWRRLTARGHFMSPASSVEAHRDLEDLGSPIGAFLRDRCTLGAGHGVRTDVLYDAWCAWCRVQGREHTGNKQTFGRDMSAAVAGLKVAQPRGDDGSRVRYYEGIGLVPEPELARSGTRADALRDAFHEDDPGPSFAQ